MLILNAPEGYLEKAGPIPPNAEVIFERKPVFIVQVFIRSMDEFIKIMAEINTLVQPGGMVWISYPKLTSPLKGDVNRDSINQTAQRYGWTGIAIISIDGDWSALRLKPL